MAWLPWRARHAQLERIRAEWGRRGPLRDRPRQLPAIADYHRSRTGDRAESEPTPSLDDRTWSDLDMDAVFTSLDRTQSTLGQQALYHRLRSAPVADHLDAFDALVRRFSTDDADSDAVRLRERLQLALTRLRNPYGYDLWWLTQPGAIASRPWHVVFPCITAMAIGALLLTPHWGGALLVFIAIGVINLQMRIATARTLAPLIGPFRQVSALIAAGEALQALEGADVDAIVGCLREDLPRLRRLNTIAFWVGRDTRRLRPQLLAGRSYYLAEVEAVLGLVRASRGAEPHLFLFDELFRGTNAVERIAAAESVLIELLPPAAPHVVVTATHDAELVDLLRESYAAYHFSDRLGPDGLIFTHRLEPGPATTRNAIALLKLHGAPAPLIARALTRAATLDRQRQASRPSAESV